MPVEVAILHFTAPPVVGGVEQVIDAHARGLASAGRPVRVITGRGTPRGNRVRAVRIPLADTRHPTIVRIQRSLAAGRVPEAFGRVVGRLTAALDAAVDGTSVLIAHNVASLPVNLALTAALHDLVVTGKGPPVIAWQHDIGATMDRYSDLQHVGDPWRLPSVAWPGVRYVAISGARAATFAELAGLPVGDVAVIPNGIDLPGGLGLSPTTARLSATLGLATEGPLFFLPARITPRKNLELAVRIVAAIRAGGRPARLIITGPTDPHDDAAPARREELQALTRRLGVDGAVHIVSDLLGRAPGRRIVGELYRSADALLYTSDDEGFGLPVLEAGLRRLPVFCTELAALREVAGAEATYLDPAAGPDELAGRILARLDADPVTRLARRVRTTYAWDRIIADRLVPLVETVAARRA